MTRLGWELARSRLRWLPLLAAGIAAAVHGRDFGATAPDTWGMAAADAELVTRVLFPAVLLAAAVEAQRSRRHRIEYAERTGVRSLLSVRAGQAAAVLLWSLLGGLSALGVGLLAASGPQGIHGAFVPSPLPVAGTVLAAALGLLLGTLLRHWSALLLAAALGAGLLALALLAPGEGWLLLDPLASSLDGPAGLQAGFTAARLLWTLALLLIALGVGALALQRSPLELLIAVLLLALGGGAAAAGLQWLAALAWPAAGLPGQ